jgi:lipopolysaccharide export LptBFGC system permease protein LptF
VKQIVITIDNLKKIGFGMILGIGVNVLFFVAAYVLGRLGDSYSLQYFLAAE